MELPYTDDQGEYACCYTAIRFYGPFNSSDNIGTDFQYCHLWESLCANGATTEKQGYFWEGLTMNCRAM